ncbi:unnamed protein product [Prunus armeniaca]|uniref:Uncharacterized protein n=1 Tax=Prunus armeniaca TaxID=36596 RepID=A0A6J5XSY0_PRUAR|nr:unnamed protein product [Prunus armeniaca]
MVAGLGSLVSLCIGGEKDFFEHIGNECGGLIELDQRTENFKYLFEAGIKTKKSHVGFLPQIVIINEGSESYFVKIKPLSPTIRPTISRLPSPKIAGYWKPLEPCVGNGSTQLSNLRNFVPPQWRGNWAITSGRTLKGLRRITVVWRLKHWNAKVGYVGSTDYLCRRVHS